MLGQAADHHHDHRCAQRRSQRLVSRSLVGSGVTSQQGSKKQTTKGLAALPLHVVYYLSSGVAFASRDVRCTP